MGRNIIFAPGEFYHLYNRGTEKRDIYNGQGDYQRFLALMFLCNGTNSVHVENIKQGQKLKQKNKQGRTLLELAIEEERGKPLVDLAAYCLMPNHFHLIVREIKEGGISLFMQKLLTGYTMYFNRRHDRTGTLFEGKFKAIHVSNDRYLAYLIAYIHLNPIKLFDSKWKENGIKNRKQAEMYLNDYLYSSYQDYCGLERIENVVLNRNALPKYTETIKDFKSTITEWLDYSTKEGI